MAGPYNSIAVANYFIEKANEEGKPITLLQLVKLPYFAHGWFLGGFGQALLDEEVEAWKYGPVVAGVYHQFKHHGSDPIREPARNSKGEVIDGTFDDNARQVLDLVWKRYKKFSGSRLIQLTHRPDSVWREVYDERFRSRPIPNKLIKSHYEQMLGQVHSQASA